jgi:hypothetical protein
MINRLHTYPMKKNETQKWTRWNTFLQQNQCQINNPLRQKVNKGNTTHQHKQQQKQGKWATLTYFGNEIRKVANILKDTNIK